MLSSCELGPRFEFPLSRADDDGTLCTSFSRFEQRRPATIPTAHIQRDIRHRPSRRHPALVAMADSIRGRQQPIKAENQHQLAAPAEQHPTCSNQQPATTPAHGRSWSTATAHGRRRIICRKACPTTILPALLGQLQQQARSHACFVPLL